jgi:hypothetical protein
MDFPTTAAFLGAALFASINVFARFDYWVQPGYLKLSWHILWIVPFLRSSVPLESIEQVIRFDPLRHSLRYFRPFGRPFSTQGALVVRSRRVPIYCSPRSFEEFRAMVLSAKEAHLAETASADS